MKKVYPDAGSALAGVLKDDMLILSGGFGLCGIPEKLIDAIKESGVKVIVGLRPTHDEELQGLDFTDHGEAGYHYDET